MAAHKLRLSQIPCKRFVGGTLGSCPFGRDCFYQHKDDYGNDIKHLDRSMEEIREEMEERRRRQTRHQSQRSLDDEFDRLAAQLLLLRLESFVFSFNDRAMDE